MAPFLIVGSGRCGSTWVYRVLREHPRLALTNEAHVLDLLCICAHLAEIPRSRTLRLHFRPEVVDVHGIVSPDEIAHFAPVFAEHAIACCEAFYRRRFPDKDILYWGDKLPGPAAIQGAFPAWPDTKVLVLVRDPRDVLCSWRAYGKVERVARNDPGMATMAAESHARTWAQSYRELLLLEGRSCVLRYEDLLADPRASFTRVLDYLGLGWTPEVEAALAGNDTFVSHGTASSAAASAGRWRSELPAGDLAIVERHCGEIMARYGYR
jgi:hypothetical protein